MSLLDIVVVFLAVIVAYQLIRIRSELRRAVYILHSLDEEVFHLAQEQNPQYRRCSHCDRRAIVRHVVPKDREPEPNAPDIFYCQRCWWMSGSVIAGD